MSNTVPQTTAALPALSLDSDSSLDDTWLIAERPVSKTYFGRYEILAPLGAGGMGRVFRVYDHELLEEVALKVLQKRRLERDPSAAMFRREVRLARRVCHPNVVRTFEFGVYRGFPYLTMEYVEGQSLSEFLAEDRALDERETLALLEPITAALAAAHAVGVIHRDVKPGNVMLAKDGRVMLTDFGLARLGDGRETISGGPAGTPAYMAPEQIRGEAPTGACDVYALGVLGYRLCTGQLPFRGNNDFSLALAKLHQQAPDPRGRAPRLSAAFAELLCRCMMPAAEDRLPSAAELATQLRAVHGGRPPEPPAPVEITSRSSTKCSLAVLPFRGSDERVQIIASGLADDLVGELSTMRRLRVIGPAHVEASDVPGTHTGAERLGASVAVEATMRAIDSGLRLNIRLLRLDDGEAIWARRVDCHAAAALELHEQLARDIRAALSVELATEGSPSRAETDAETLELMLRARAGYQRFDLTALGEAQAHIEAALERAPEDPSVWASAALILARRWLLEREPDPELLARARALAQAAVVSAGELGDSHLALGSVQYFAGESLAAARSLRAAVAHSPSSPDAHELLGVLLLEAGLIDVATSASSAS